MAAPLIIKSQQIFCYRYRGAGTGTMALHLRQPIECRGPAVTKEPEMSNPWLSIANSVANSARGTIAAEAKRQATGAVNKASKETLSIWTDAMMAAAEPKLRKKR